MLELEGTHAALYAYRKHLPSDQSNDILQVAQHGWRRGRNRSWSWRLQPSEKRFTNWELGSMLSQITNRHLITFIMFSES